MELLKDYIELIILAVTAIGSVAGLVYALTGSEKAKKVSERANLIEDQALYFVEKAEEFSNMTGRDKKEWVINRVTRSVQVKGFTVDRDEIDHTIERLITFSNKVNKKLGK